MAPGGLQNQVPGGHGDNLARGIVPPGLRAADHIPAPEAASGVGQAIPAGNGHGGAHQLLDSRRSVACPIGLEGHGAPDAVNGHLGHVQGQTGENVVLKDTGVQAAVGVVLRGGNGAAVDNGLLNVGVRVQLHLQHKVQVHMTADVIQKDVDPLAVLRDRGTHIHNAFGVGVAALDGGHHALPLRQLQGEADIVVVVVDDMLQIQPHLIPENYRVHFGVGGGDVGGLVVGVPVVGGVSGQQFAGLIRQLPGDECVTGSQLLGQGFQFFLNIGFAAPAELLPQHPKDHCGDAVAGRVELPHRGNGLIQRRRLVGHALARGAVVEDGPKQVTFITLYAAVIDRILVCDQPGAGVYAVVVNIVQAIVPHHALKFLVGPAACCGHVYQENEVHRVGGDALLAIADHRPGALQVGIFH